MDPGIVPLKHTGIEELWFTLTKRCNLACPDTCYNSSSPGNESFDTITADDVRPLAERFPHLQHIYYTGGEPFVLREHIMPLIETALDHADLTVLTNGLLVHQYAQELASIDASHTLTFRVSLDHYRPERHDAMRRRKNQEAGTGNFERTLDNITLLDDLDYPVIVTGTANAYSGRSHEQTIASYRDMLDRRGLPNVGIQVIPRVLQLGNAQLTIEGEAQPAVTTDCMASMSDYSRFMCHNSRAYRKVGNVVERMKCVVLSDLDDFREGVAGDGKIEGTPIPHVECRDYCYLAGGGCTDNPT